MERKKKFNILITFLVIVCLAQAVVIAYMAMPDYSVFKNENVFSSFVHKKFKEENKNQWDRFDNFFDDHFFLNNNDPFMVMDDFHQRMDEMMEEKLKPSFRHSWNSWFDDRFSLHSDKVEMQVSETKKNYIVELKMPIGVQDNELKIDINQKGISIEGDFKKILEKEDEHGNVIARTESRQSISQKFSLPDDADYENASIDQTKSKTIITLPKIQLS